MKHRAIFLLFVLAGLVGVRALAYGQDSLASASRIQLIAPAPLTPATASRAGTWRLRLTTPKGDLETTLRLAQDPFAPCALSLLLNPAVDSGCLRADLPGDWPYLLGYAAGQWLNVVRVQDSVWAVVPGDGIISGVSRTGDLTLRGTMQGHTVRGSWVQTYAPDSLRGTFELVPQRRQ